jgi:hypothetical protein
MKERLKKFVRNENFLILAFIFLTFFWIGFPVSNGLLRCSLAFGIGFGFSIVIAVVLLVLNFNIWRKDKYKTLFLKLNPKSTINWTLCFFLYFTPIYFSFGLYSDGLYSECLVINNGSNKDIISENEIVFLFNFNEVIQVNDKKVLASTSVTFGYKNNSIEIITEERLNLNGDKEKIINYSEKKGSLPGKFLQNSKTKMALENIWSEENNKEKLIANPQLISEELKKSKFLNLGVSTEWDTTVVVTEG